MNRVNANREFYSSRRLSIHHLQHLGSSSHAVARLPPRHSPVGIHTCLRLIFDMAATTIRDAIKAVTGQQFVALDQYKLQEAGPKLFSIDDLPLIPVDKAMLKTSNFTYAFEIEHNAGFMDFQEMHHGLLHNERLPEPLAFKQPLSQVDVQYVHIHEDDGSNTLIKHIYVGSSKVRKLTSQLVSASHGPIYCLDVSKITARRLIPQIVHISWLDLVVLVSTSFFSSCNCLRSKIPRPCAWMRRLTTHMTTSRRVRPCHPATMPFFAGSPSRRTIRRVRYSHGHHRRLRRPSRTSFMVKPCVRCWSPTLCHWSTSRTGWFKMSSFHASGIASNIASASLESVE